MKATWASENFDRFIVVHRPPGCIKTGIFQLSAVQKTGGRSPPVQVGFYWNDRGAQRPLQDG